MIQSRIQTEFHADVCALNVDICRNPNIEAKHTVQQVSLAVSCFATLDDDDEITEMVESVEASVYTNDLTRWLAGDNGRLQYMQDVIEEGGITSAAELLNEAQRRWIEQIWRNVHCALITADVELGEISHV